jgi:hypothetical protein
VRWVAFVVGALVVAAGIARADGFDKLPEGAIAYASARPIAVVGAMQRLGIDQLPAMQRLKKQLGGIDPFNPVIMAAPGIDVAAPLVASLFEPVVGLGMHTRVVAQLRDKATFNTFVMGVIASGQLPLGPAPGIKDAVAMGNPAPTTVLLVRVIGNEALLDLVEVDDGKKAPPAAELARRFPPAPLRKFVPGRGARRLLAPDSAAVLYVDARKLEPMFVQLGASDRRRELAAATGAERAQLAAKQRQRAKQCALWKRAPSLFDDAALALAATPDALTLTWAWGTQSGPPLGGLKLTAVDDGALDGPALGHDGAGMFALYAASLTPFTSLKRSGLFASSESFTEAVDGCDTQAGLLLLLRSWPLAIGTLAGSTPPAGSPLLMLKQSIASLRTVVVGLRDFNANGPRIAVAASFDASTRGSFELMLAAFGGGAGAVTKVGKRSPTIYSLQLPDSSRPPLAVGLETMAGGRFGLAVGDSDESLAWAYKTGDGATSRIAQPPLARLSADATLLGRLGSMLGLGSDQQAVLDMLARLRRVDGTLAADGDLFSLTLHAPLKP